ncbi:putative CRISPR-associated protein, partial [Suttonella ornithocola]
KHIEQRKQKILSGLPKTDIKKMSAELNSLLTWQNSNPKLDHIPDIHILLATDTFLSNATANIIKAFLENQKETVILLDDNKDLKTSSLLAFRTALSELSRKLIEIITAYKAEGYEIHFNLTGGFKSLNGFLQAVGTLYADKVFYLFEGAQELLYIPKLPIELHAKEAVEKNLTAIRRLEQKLSITKEQQQQIPELFLFDIGDENVGLSEWGELIWNQYKNEIYLSLRDSISEKIIFADSFEPSVKGLSSQLIQDVNKKVTMLAAYTESDCKNNLKSLDVKPLQGTDYKERNLWECDLDGNHRIFMTKQENNRFRLEKVGDALHSTRKKV